LVAIYGVFLLFVTFYKKDQIKPPEPMLPIVVAFAVEIFIPYAV
jgi:hypothetical protein